MIYWTILLALSGYGYYVAKDHEYTDKAALRSIYIMVGVVSIVKIIAL